ncbi:hypothetical protein HUJ04_009767 [Dendroctonus ponderosae]|nr:hypothetical protein HUJ04_009767 [Dendroctonus ponderosae]
MISVARRSYVDSLWTILLVKPQVNMGMETNSKFVTRSKTITVPIYTSIERDLNSRSIIKSAISFSTFKTSARNPFCVVVFVQG